MMGGITSISTHEQFVKDIAAAVPKSAIDMNRIVAFARWCFENNRLDAYEAGRMAGLYFEFSAFEGMEE